MADTYSHRATLHVPCPQCGVAKSKYCVPKHRRWAYESPVWTHKARHTAYSLSLSGAKPEVLADIRTVLKILSKYAAA